MITRSEFDKYKQFRKQAGCPFCSRREVFSGDGLYYCNLDNEFNSLYEKIINKFIFKRFFPSLITDDEFQKEADKNPTTYFAFYCEICRRYWIDDITGKMIKEIPWNIEEIQKGNSEWFTASPREAVIHLAEKANEFFEQEYHKSKEIHSIIKTYSELLAKAQMELLHYRHTTNKSINEIIKPYSLSYDKLTDWMFATIQNSLMKKFPYRSDCIHQALTLYNDSDEKPEMQRAVCEVLANKMMSSFANELFRSIKEYYERVLQNEYPDEYGWFLNNKEWLNGLWNELYGRSIKIIYVGLQNFGIEISLIDMKKIVFGNLDVTGQGVGVNIDKSAILGNVNNYASIYINIIREKMIEINAGVKVDNSSVGSVISKPTVFVGSDNVVNSFNKVKEQFGEETANVIQQIAEIVEKSENVVAAKLFEAFNEEMSKPEPKKTVLQSIWSGLSSVLPDLSTIVSIVEKIMKIIR